MDTWQKVVGAITVVVIAFASGYHYAASIKDAQIAKLKEDYAKNTVAIQEEYRAKERFALESMADAWDQRDAAYARLTDLTGDVRRLRDEASAARRRLSKATKDSCKSEREQLDRCTNLIVRGADLVQRGVNLSTKSAIDKDTLVKLVQ